MFDVRCSVFDVSFAESPHARLSLARPSRAPAVCTPPGTSEVPGGKLALRSDHGNVHSPAPDFRTLGTRRHGHAPDAHAHADALFDAARSVAPGTLRPAPDEQIELAEKEIHRTHWDKPFHELAQLYHRRFIGSRDTYAAYGRNLVAAFGKFQKLGKLEIITSAATHAVLPLLANHPASLRAQILVARDHYRSCFGCDPRGIWLPECAYVDGVEPVLQAANIRWFITDTHGLLHASPRPRYGVFAPIFTPNGMAAFGRDLDSAKQVWSKHEGYPGDATYRDFYRDIGFDLPIEHLGPIARGTRKFSGVKYHRITGRGEEKQLYDRTAAENAAAQHATHFLEQCHQQIREIGEMGFEPIIVAPFDAELFGHWWFEGPIFLEQFIRCASNESDFRLTTPSEYLAAHPTQQIVEPAASTWGDKGHLAVWLDPSNAWIYPQLNVATQKMSELAEQTSAVAGQSRKHSGLPNQPSAGEAPALQITDRVLKQLARELLLAQASDWAFLMKTGTAREYATQRTIDHLDRFNRLHDQFVTNNLDEEFLCDCERRDNIFSNVNWRYYV